MNRSSRIVWILLKYERYTITQNARRYTMRLRYKRLIYQGTNKDEGREQTHLTSLSEQWTPSKPRKWKKPRLRKQRNKTCGRGNPTLPPILGRFSRRPRNREVRFLSNNLKNFFDSCYKLLYVVTRTLEDGVIHGLVKLPSNTAFGRRRRLHLDH